MSSSETYPHLRIANEIKPLLHRYGIPYGKNANKATLLGLLRENGVPLSEVKQHDGPARNLNSIEVLGLDQIAKDYPNNGSEDSENASRTSSSPDPPSESGSSDSGSTESGDQTSSSGESSTTQSSLLQKYGVPRASPELRKRVNDLPGKIELVTWMASLVLSQKIPMGPAMVFFDYFISTPDINVSCIDYLLNKEDIQNTWYEKCPNPAERKAAAKSLSMFWELGTNPGSLGGRTTTIDANTEEEGDFLMEIKDPYDGAKTMAKVLGKHMTKNKVLAVRAESLSLEHPNLGRGFWIDCKEGKELSIHFLSRARFCLACCSFEKWHPALDASSIIRATPVGL